MQRHERKSYLEASTSELARIKYIESLPFFAKSRLAHQENNAVAQRILAEYYYKNGNYRTSADLWKKSADNHDPIALLHIAGVHIECQQPDQAKQCLDKAMLALKTYRDTEYVAIVKKIIESTQDRLAHYLLDCAVDAYKKQDALLSLRYFEESAELGNSAAAINAGKIYLGINHAKTEYYAKLALYLSKKNKDVNLHRAEGHKLLGRSYAIQINENSKYRDFLAVISEMRISLAYRENEDLSKELREFLERIDDWEIREDLLSDSRLVHYNGSVFKTVADERNSGVSINELDRWLEYKDPRIARSRQQLFRMYLQKQDQVENAQATHRPK